MAANEYLDKALRVRLKPDYLLEQIDNEFTVYHPSLTVSVYLNESGALIWELCREERSVAEVIEILQAAYPESSKQIERDVVHVIGELISHDILELVN